MGFLSTSRTFSVPIASSRDEALTAARKALAGLDWPTRTEGEALVATEDFARLHCHCQPISVRVELAPSLGEETMLLVSTSVPGRGPIASRHIDTQSDVLIRRILASAAAN